MTVRRSFSISTQNHGKKVVEPATDATAEPVQAPQRPTGRVPRITRLMALAIKFDGYLRDGLVHDYAELARLGHVSRARITQIMDLTLLAPKVQEAILDLPLTMEGRDGVNLKDLISIGRESIWCDQRAMWKSLIHARSIQ
jgi:hypothetical protein